MIRSETGTGVWPETQIRKMGKTARTNLKRQRRLKEISGLVLIFMVCALFYVWSRVRLVRYGYEIAEIKTERNKLLDIQKALHLEVATLKSPARLEEIAKNNFKMSRPRINQIVFVKAK